MNLNVLFAPIILSTYLQNILKMEDAVDQYGKPQIYIYFFLLYSKETSGKALVKE